MNKFFKTVSSLLAVVLLCPIISVSAEDSRRSVILGGVPFGLTMYTNGVVVVNVDKDDSPAKNAGIKENDIITKANGEEINSNEQLQEVISSSQGEDIELSVLRGKSPISLTLTPKLIDENYAAGMWIRDSTAGLGTVTYFDPQSHTFGALGHGIYDSDTGILLPLKKGKAVQAEMTSIVKARDGAAGGLNGYMTDEVIGEMTLNSGFGVYGRYTAAKGDTELPCAFDSEIHTGSAAVYTTLDGDGVKSYEVEIVSLNLGSNSGQNMVIRVTDGELLDKTGGIVQGMSGSPIVQDGRLIGALTHVFVNSPEKGYAISIGNMLSCCEQYG